MKKMRFIVLVATVLVFVLMASPVSAEKKYGPGVTDTEIKIGNTNPYSGPASAYGTIGKSAGAYFEKVNAQGGINGRKIKFITYDDQYSPPKTKEMFRKLVERDKVLLIFEPLGTAPNAALRGYMSKKKVPQLFIASGFPLWDDPENYPWTMGWQPSYATEADIFAKFVMKKHPNGKVGILYQNDDYGKSILNAFKKSLGDKAKSMVVAEESYDTSQPSIASQVIKLKASGADILVNVTTPKFSIQSINKMHELNWKPVHLMNSVGASMGAVLKKVGFEKCIGIITNGYLMDPSDPEYKDSKGIKVYKEFMAKYYPNGEVDDINNVYGYAIAQTLVHVLENCGDNLTRENVMKQAANIKKLKLDVLIDGIAINTSPTDYSPIESMQPRQFNGKYYEPFGEVVIGGNDKK